MKPPRARGTIRCGPPATPVFLALLLLVLLLSTPHILAAARDDSPQGNPTWSPVWEAVETRSVFLPLIRNDGEPPPPPPVSCPQTGKWSGAGTRISVEFNVSWDGSTCQAYAMTYSLSVTCRTPSGGSWTFYVIDDHLQNTAIAEGQFSTKDSHLTTTLKGAFNGGTAVAGTWSYYHFNPSNLATCSGSGTWTGSPAR